MQLSYDRIHNTDLVSSKSTTKTTKKNNYNSNTRKNPRYSDMPYNNNNNSNNNTTTKNFGNEKLDQRYDDNDHDHDSISSVSTFDYMSDLFEPIPWDVHNDAPVTALLPSPFTQRCTKIASITLPTTTATTSCDYVFHPSQNNNNTTSSMSSQYNNTNHHQHHHPTSPPTAVSSPPMIPSMPPPPSQSSISYLSPYRPTHYYQQQPFVTPDQHAMPARVQSSSFSYNPTHNISYLAPPVLAPWKTTENNKVVPVKKNSRKRQPRPRIVIQPRCGGIIYEPLPNDVLAGRGGRINSHRGNIKYRTIVAQNKSAYLDPKVRKLEKAHIAASIVHQIRSYGGRFLAESNDGTWYEVGDAKAIRKTGQALREDAQSVRVGTAVISSFDDTENIEDNNGNNNNNNNNNNRNQDEHIAHTNRRSSLSSTSTGESTTSTASTINHQNHPGKQYLTADSNNTIVQAMTSTPFLLPSPEPISDTDRNDSYTSLSSLVSISTIGTHASFIPLDDFLEHTSLLDMNN